jgi:tRNA pseudouridine55 synthase
MGIDGLLIVDKPEGITSLGVVREVKRRLGVRKAGHIGTLDPFATGVLPIALNEGTKLVPFLEGGRKEYEGVLRLGEETSTDDPTGEVLSAREWKAVSLQAIEAVFGSFLGKIRQIPPMFSAVKIGGEPLYRLARKGLEVDRKEREIEIFDLKIVDADLPYVGFRVACSKGTYVRTFARDIGRKLGCCAHLVRLRRTRSGPFTLERAIPWGSVKSGDSRTMVHCLIPLREALPSFPEVVGDHALVRKARLGMRMAAQDLAHQSLPAFTKGDWIKMSGPEGGLIAILRSEVSDLDIGRTEPGRVVLRPIRLFHPSSGAKDKAKEECYGNGGREEEGDY